jgi:hypothetical protein
MEGTGEVVDSSGSQSRNAILLEQVRSDQISKSASVAWHYEFSLAQKERLEKIRLAVADAFPISQDDWEDGFRKDAAPEREIALWEHVAKFYAHFAGGRIPSPDARKELLGFLFACAEGYKTAREAQSRLKHIEPQLADTILGCYLFDTFSLDDSTNCRAEK